MPASNTLIEQIHTSGRQLVIAVTGGGSQAIADLLTVPGASASVLEAVAPYSLPALEDWLGGTIDHACSERTARAMAMAAFERARVLSGATGFSSAAPAESPLAPRSSLLALLGIGVTASLATTRPKRGPHRIHVAAQSATATVAYSVQLAKGQRPRADEETVASQLALHAIAEACGVAQDPPANPSPSEPIARREKLAPATWTELLLNQRNLISGLVASATRFPAPHLTSAAPPHLIFPGAFNPLHAGHRHMAQLAADRLGTSVMLELSTTNVDKPPLDFLEIDDRLQKLTDYPVILTRAPTFVEKAVLLPGSTFIVGADTLARVADPAYYANSAELRDAAVATLAAHHCRFLVFGRTLNDRKLRDRFTTLSDLELPPHLRALCDEVPESDFRDDTSSTNIRTRE